MQFTKYLLSNYFDAVAIQRPFIWPILLIWWQNCHFMGLKWHKNVHFSLLFFFNSSLIMAGGYQLPTSLSFFVWLQGTLVSNVGRGDNRVIFSLRKWHLPTGTHTINKPLEPFRTKFGPKKPHTFWKKLFCHFGSFSNLKNFTCCI